MVAKQKQNKAKIVVMDKNDSEIKTLTVLFNPNKYTIKKTSKFNSAQINNEDNPALQYLSGDASTLSMELFFDTYHQRDGGSKAYEDVRKYTDEIQNLLYIHSDDHQPPMCLVSWGSLAFKGYLTDLTEDFTMFSNEGMPVRALLKVSFKGYTSMKEQMQSTSKQSADRTKERTLKEGDQLWAMAAKEYDDPDKWREIAKANNIDNPRKLKNGQRVIVPSLE